MKKVFIVDSSAVIRSIEKKIIQLTYSCEVCGESSDIKAVLNIPDKFADFIFIEASRKNIIEVEKILLHKKKISSNLILLADEKIELIQKVNVLQIWTRPDLLSCSSEKLRSIASFVDTRLEELKASSFLLRKKSKKVFNENKNSRHVLANNSYKLVLIGVSTGGPGTILKLLGDLKKNFPLPILITQHIDSSFEKNLTEWLNNSLPMPIHIAKDGIIPLAGHVYFAPADFHMEIGKNIKNEIIIKLTSAPPVNFLRPSVDRLFLSGADVLKSDVISVLLTGMGADGARGSFVLKENGAYTIGESEETCVVYGMSKAAYDMGGIVELLPLYKISERLIKLSKGTTVYG